MSNKEHKDIYAALAAAQGSIGGVVAKNANNPHFRSSYADLSAITALVMPALSAEGIAYSVGTHIEEGLLHVETKLSVSEDSHVKVTIPIPIGPRATAHALGSALTYGRRYGLAALTGVAQADDDGNAASEAASQQQPKQQPQPKPQQQPQPQQQQQPQPQPQPKPQPQPQPEQVSGVVESTLKQIEGCNAQRLEAAQKWAEGNLSGKELEMVQKAIAQRKAELAS